MKADSKSRWIDSALVLDGTLIRLEPLQAAHARELFAVAGDEDIWRYLLFDLPRSVSDMQQFIGLAERARDLGSAVPFIIRDVHSGTAIGSTRFLEINAEDRNLAIGWTWLGRAWWRTGANLESKYLLLRHAFEAAGAIRVQIKADERNKRSLRAIEQLGAVREGVLRQHRILKDGYRRTSVIYSILDFEWPAVKEQLEARLAGARPTP